MEFWWFVLLLLFIIIYWFEEVTASSSYRQVTKKCDYGNVTVHYGENIVLCIPCHVCPRGHEPSIRCGSSFTIEENIKPRIKCRRCQKGTYSASPSMSDCKPCSTCKPNERVIRKCTRRSDTVCNSTIACEKGRYFSRKISACLPCWRCCNNETDVRIEECAAQGSQYSCSFESYKHCNYHGNGNLTITRTSRPFTEVHFITRNISRIIYAFSNAAPTLQTNLYINSKTIPVIILLIVLSITFLISLIVCNLVRRRRNRSKKESLCFPVMPSKRLKQDSDIFRSENDQSDCLDDFAKYNSYNLTYFFKCGVCLRHDETSTIDGSRNLAVKIVEDAAISLLETIDPGYIFLSATFRFYTQGTEFEKPVEISLPHSALDPKVENWDSKVLYLDEREGKNAKWKEIEGEVKVESNNVKFLTKKLLTFAVVGRPIKSAKKRMQFALFSMQKMISDRLEMMLYLLDESDYHLDQLMRENKNEGWEMLGFLHAAFVDCCSPFDIIVDVEDIVEPWSLVKLNDKVISSRLLYNSYFNIPSVRATFRRSERRAQTFSCKFRVDVGGSEIIIPAITFVPQELLCTFIDVHNEDPSLFERGTLLKNVDYDIMYQMCRKLDIPAKGKGQWRDVGRFFDVDEDVLQKCCQEYATLDGSPSRRLMEYIFTSRPQLTVGEMNKCLDELGRGDVVSVLGEEKRPVKHNSRLALEKRPFSS